MLDSRGQANPGLVVLVVVLIIAVVVIFFVLREEQDDAELEVDLGARAVPAAVAQAGYGSPPARLVFAPAVVDGRSHDRGGALI